MKNNIKALLIDIDDTITTFKDDAEYKGEIYNLFRVLELAGVELAGLSMEEAKKRIGKVKDSIKWWIWEDFIKELGLDHDEFWEYAYKMEKEYMLVTGPELKPALERLKNNGVFLYITSNNPSSGIYHKLRLAGFERDEVSDWFSAILGVSELECMKWDEAYWRKVILLTGIKRENLATLGDNIKDDYQIPTSVGIGHSFVINRKEDLSSENKDNLTYVQCFKQVADIILED